jgi:hypothetical protein
MFIPNFFFSILNRGIWNWFFKNIQPFFLLGNNSHNWFSIHEIWSRQFVSIKYASKGYITTYFIYQPINYLDFLNIIHTTKLWNKIILESLGSRLIDLELFRDLLHKLQVVANYKSSNFSTSNGNPHESPVRNLINSYLEERDCYA